MASIQHQTQAARETGADAAPDSGAVGDRHAAACRAELWRMADARGTGVGRGDAARRRARAGRDRRPQREEEEQMANRASCNAVERRAGSPSATQGVPNGLKGTLGTLRRFQTLYGPYSGENLFYSGPKGDKCAGFRQISLGPALGAFGGMSGGDRVSPIVQASYSSPKGAIAPTTSSPSCRPAARTMVHSP